MNWTLLLSSLFAGAIFLAGHADAGFLIDGFTAPPTSPYTSSGSFGKVEDNADALGGKRGFNITALFDSSVTLVIDGGTASYSVVATGAFPSASLTLRYTDPTAANTLTLADEAIIIRNVSTNSNWNLSITLKGNASGSPSTATGTLGAGYNGDAVIPFALFSGPPAPHALGGINEVEFIFSTNSAGLLTLGSMNVTGITAVPEPSWLALLGIPIIIGRKLLARCARQCVPNAVRP